MRRRIVEQSRARIVSIVTSVIPQAQLTSSAIIECTRGSNAIIF